jgi:hypothetical protein
MNLSDIEMTPLIAFFSTFGIFSFGYLISSFVVSYMSYLPLHDELEDDDEEYENSINEKFNNLDIIDLSENYISELKNKFAIEMTHQGELILCYNNETESYNYWCDSKNIYFNTLELISKKYVTDYNCKKLYQYDKKTENIEQSNAEQSGSENTAEEQSGSENTAEEQSGSENTAEEQNNSTTKNVFANFKDYNKKSKNVEKEIIKNRYSYRGKIKDWNVDIHKLSKKNDIDTSSDISFKNFKNK